MFISGDLIGNENNAHESYDKFFMLRDNMLDMRMSHTLLHRMDCVAVEFSLFKSRIDMLNNCAINGYPSPYIAEMNSHERYLLYCGQSEERLKEAHEKLAEMHKPTLYGILSGWFCKITRHPIRTIETALLNCFDWAKNLVIATIKIVLESEPSYRSNERCKKCQNKFVKK